MDPNANSQSIGIVGAGWYGIHLALQLKKCGFDVTLLEVEEDILSKVSGQFGIRLHTGLHYPRSPATRKSCQEGFDAFCQHYPQLINDHFYSIYGLGASDADHETSKVDHNQFDAVCRELGNHENIDVQEWGYQDLIAAINIQEPSAIVGERLRKTFKKMLAELEVKVLCNTRVTTIEKSGNQFLVNEHLKFDQIINATGFQSLLPADALPFEMEIVYQPCLALVYEDLEAGVKPISFIVVDGWFPCLMPYDDRIEEEESCVKHYIVTHGKWTILGSYHTASEAEENLSCVTDAFIQEHVRPNCESEMARFWPRFPSRYRYVKWIGSVLAKIKTDKEFRSAVTFQEQTSGIIHIIPGKISHVFDTEHEALSLIKKEKLLTHGNYTYIKGGVLDQAIGEITEAPGSRSTSLLQPYEAHLDAVSPGSF